MDSFQQVQKVHATLSDGQNLTSWMATKVYRRPLHI